MKTKDLTIKEFYEQGKFDELAKIVGEHGLKLSLKFDKDNLTKLTVKKSSSKYQVYFYVDEPAERIKRHLEDYVIPQVFGLQLKINW